MGDHLRKVRMDRGLPQPQAAKMLGITSNSLTTWELNQYQPQVKHWPNIIAWLGYYPEADDGSIGYQLRKYRRYEGIRQKILAKRIGVDEKTLWRIEMGPGKRPAQTKTLEKINKFIQAFRLRTDIE